MTRLSCYALKALLDAFAETQALEILKNTLNEILLAESSQIDIEGLIKVYNDSLAVIVPKVFDSEINAAVIDAVVIDDNQLDLLHKAYQELEAAISLKGEDKRYKFIIVIPVADRPMHLQACLESLYELCEKFAYGGINEGNYQKLQVVVADDSKDESSIDQHKQIASDFNSKGIEVDYFGLKDQLFQVDNIPKKIKSKLSCVLGENKASSFYHKGASIMRNIVYLKLNEILKEDEKILFYFIDSDQEFKVKVNSAGQDKNLYLVNYLYELDKIFTQKDITMLTGKVVGDPPVSPAVMAGNFLDDVIAFLQQSSKLGPSSLCRFHSEDIQQASDASYHDMAELFGFKQKSESYEYHCALQGEHTNAKSFETFSNELNRFFYGEHPTRKMYYEYEDALQSVNSARTVYTGNYIFNPKGLKYFIPFATLKLRMAGPVLGRIIKSELGEKFVSANLPMLHKRTFEDTGVSEFRPGIEQSKQQLDLSGEFERQYFGDVMLFSIQQLTESGYPDKDCSIEDIKSVLNMVEESVNQKYIAKQKDIMNKLSQLNEIFTAKDNWWNNKPELKRANFEMQGFIDNIHYNFSDDSKGMALVNSETHKIKRLGEMLEGIKGFAKDRDIWSEVLELNVYTL